uniref:G_PROTEIN_RECEP_F1_2 domain-containing protein n=1 Tax=Steinernema glaseri TaxID=37863 RepID=A0A1I7YJA3_9BILA
MSSDVVEEYYSSFLYVRRIILINTAFSVPLNFLTMYLILFKTPKHLKTYKYLLLNISVWAFLTDILLHVFLLPLPLIDVLVLYITGVGKRFGTTILFSIVVTTVYCMIQYVAALQFALFYRYWALKRHFKICGKLMTKWHYIVGTLFVVIAPAGSIAFVTTSTHASKDELRSRLLEHHEELLAPLEFQRTLGFDQERLYALCLTVLLWTVPWIIAVFLCIRGIMGHFKEYKSNLSDATYRLHVQLLIALAIQVSKQVPSRWRYPQ